ncbi:MAG: methylmalonyl-CoA mutase family protein [Acidobacteriota bacterium]
MSKSNSQKERKEKFLTQSNIEIKNIYDFKDLENFNPELELGEPGEFPFTRGIYNNMYRGKLWTMRQYAGYGTAEESNKRYKYLISQGQTGLSVAFDLPTQIGYNSDHPMAKGEIGKVGVSINSLEDMEILFDGIPLENISVSMTINATALMIIAMYLVLAKKRRIDWKKLTGTIQNDILKEYVSRGTYIFPVKESMKIITDIFSFLTKHVPQWNIISISGYHIREAGANAIQELAFTFANAITYVQSAIERGLDVDEFAPRISFFFAAHNNFFEEIAKFRAARRIWARIMKEKFKAEDKSSMLLRFHTQTSGSTLTFQQSDLNIVRVTLQCLAAVLGGTQSLHSNSRDEALSLPTEESVRIALRTQQIIAYETGAADTVDPLGGSYFLESLTNQIEDSVNRYLKKIEELGGMIKAIETGWVQREIQNSSYEYQKKIEKEEEIIVGVNKFEIKEDVKFDILKISDEFEKKQIENLKKLMQKRESEKVLKSLKRIKESAKKEENLVYPVMEAVENYATLGEIVDCLKEVYGVYQEKSVPV